MKRNPFSLEDTVAEIRPLSIDDLPIENFIAELKVFTNKIEQLINDDLLSCMIDSSKKIKISTLKQTLITDINNFFTNPKNAFARIPQLQNTWRQLKNLIMENYHALKNQKQNDNKRQKTDSSTENNNNNQATDVMAIEENTPSLTQNLLAIGGGDILSLLGRYLNIIDFVRLRRAVKSFKFNNGRSFQDAANSHYWKNIFVRLPDKWKLNYLVQNNNEINYQAAIYDIINKLTTQFSPEVRKLFFNILTNPENTVKKDIHDQKSAHNEINSYLTKPEFLDHTYSLIQWAQLLEQQGFLNQLYKVYRYFRDKEEGHIRYNMVNVYYPSTLRDNIYNKKYRTIDALPVIMEIIFGRPLQTVLNHLSLHKLENYDFFHRIAFFAYAYGHYDVIAYLVAFLKTRDELQTYDNTPISLHENLKLLLLNASGFCFNNITSLLLEEYVAYIKNNAPIENNDTLYLLLENLIVTKNLTMLKQAILIIGLDNIDYKKPFKLPYKKDNTPITLSDILQTQKELEQTFLNQIFTNFRWSTQLSSEQFLMLCAEGNVGYETAKSIDVEQLNAQNTEQKTGLMLLCQKQKTDVASFLACIPGVNLAIQDQQGNTFLSYFLHFNKDLLKDYENNPEYIELFFSNVLANFNDHQNSNNNTPHYLFNSFTTLVTDIYRKYVHTNTTSDFIRRFILQNSHPEMRKTILNTMVQIPDSNANAIVAALLSPEVIDQSTINLRIIKKFITEKPNQPISATNKLKHVEREFVFVDILKTNNQPLIEHAEKTVFDGILEDVLHSTIFAFIKYNPKNTTLYPIYLETTLLNLIDRFASLEKQRQIKSIIGLEASKNNLYSQTLLIKNIMALAIEMDSIALLQSAETILKKLCSKTCFDEIFNKILQHKEFHQNLVGAQKKGLLKHLFQNIRHGNSSKLVIHLLTQKQAFQSFSSDECKELFFEALDGKNIELITIILNILSDKIFDKTMVNTSYSYDELANPAKLAAIQARALLTAEQQSSSNQYQTMTIKDFLSYCMTALTKIPDSDALLETFYAKTIAVMPEFKPTISLLIAAILNKKETLLIRLLSHINDVRIIAGLIHFQDECNHLYRPNYQLILLTHLYDLFKRGKRILTPGQNILYFRHIGFILDYAIRSIITSNNQEDFELGGKIVDLVLTLCRESKLVFPADLVPQIEKNEAIKKFITPENLKWLEQFTQLLTDPTQLLNDSICHQYPALMSKDDYILNVYENYFFFVKKFDPQNQQDIDLAKKISSVHTKYFMYNVPTPEIVALYKLANLDISCSAEYLSLSLKVDPSSLLPSKPPSSNETSISNNNNTSMFQQAPSVKFPFASMRNINQLNQESVENIIEEPWSYLSIKKSIIHAPFMFFWMKDIEKPLSAFYQLYPNIINSRTPFRGTTILHIACYLGEFKLANHLISQGANPIKNDNHGLFPINYAFLDSAPYHTRKTWNERIAFFLENLLLTIPKSNENSHVLAQLQNAFQTHLIKIKDANYGQFLTDVTEVLQAIPEEQKSKELLNYAEGIQFAVNTLSSMKQALNAQKALNNNQQAPGISNH